MAKRRRSRKHAGYKVVRVKGVGSRCKATKGKKKGKFVKGYLCGL